MANLPTNSTYQTPASTPVVPKDAYRPSSFSGSLAKMNTSGSSPFAASSTPMPAMPKTTGGGTTYSPSNFYQNLSKIKSAGSPFTPSPTGAPGSPEAFAADQASTMAYGSMVNQGQGIPTQQPFLPQDINQVTQIPSDYGTWMPPSTIKKNDGTNLSWGSPVSPVIKNMAGDVQGQYVEDTSDPNLLVKTVRGNNSLNDSAIHNGRAGFMYQIDHIMPLELGGADTLANRELLTSQQNDQKTKAQAIPYTLYAHGELSLSDARKMAMSWKNRDLTNIPEPDGFGMLPDSSGKSGIQLARDTAKMWSEPHVPTMKEKIGQIPQAAEEFGKGWLPDPLREFIKGAASGLSLGFVPYQQGKDEGLAADISGKVGMIAGGVGSFLLGGELIDGALGLAGLARGAIGARMAVTAAKAAEVGFETTPEALSLVNAATTGAKIASTAGTEAATGATRITFNSLNKVPNYLANMVQEGTVKQMGKFAVTSAVMGQGQQFIANHFNPYTLSGQAYQKNEENVTGTILKDLALGAVSGIGSPTIKGTAYATMLPLTLSYLGNPNDPMGALINGVSFGALHAIGTVGKPGYNNIEMMGGKPYAPDKATQAFEDTVNKAAHASLSYYAPEEMASYVKGAPGSEQLIQTAKDKAIENVWRSFFGEKGATPEEQAKTLADFKGFSAGLDKGLETKAPEPLTGLSKFSMRARLARSKEAKAQKADISEAYGKGYQTKNIFEGNTSDLKNEGMDLQTALTEIKRITIAGRQLYKGGLSAEMRNKADLDDLLSYGKNNLQNRYASLENYINPPSVNTTVDWLKANKPDFMSMSYDNEASIPYDPASPTPNGIISATGFGLEHNKARVSNILSPNTPDQITSPNVLIVNRPDFAPLMRMKNTLTTDPKRIYENPQNNAQVFAIRQNPKTGVYTLIDAGYIASPFVHNRFNSQPGVTEGNMKPLNMHKDDIIPKMQDANIPVLIGNIDKISSQATITSDNPFLAINVKNQNYELSKQLGAHLNAQPEINPVSMDISKFNNTKDAKEKSDIIATMNQKMVRPASAYIPVDPIETVPTPKKNKATTPKETTRSVLKDTERALSINSPEQAKTTFDMIFGIKLDDNQAADIFARKNEVTMREMIGELTDAVNADKTNLLTRLRMEFVKTYLESGALQFNDGGKAVLDMPILGGLKGAQAAKQEQNITKLAAHKVSEKEIIPSASPDAHVIHEPTVTAAPITNQSTDIAANAANEPGTVSTPIMKQDIKGEAVTPKSKTAANADEFIQEAKDRMNNMDFSLERNSSDYDKLFNNEIAKALAITRTRMQESPGMDEKTITNAQDQVQKELNRYKEFEMGKLAKEEKNVSKEEEQSQMEEADAVRHSKAVLRRMSDKGASAESIAKFVKKQKLETPEDITKGFAEEKQQGIDQWVASKKAVGPVVASTDSTFDSINRNLKGEKGTPAYSSSEAMDAAFKKMTGDNYAENKRLRELLPRFFNNTSSQINLRGKEITQNKGLLALDAAGADKSVYDAKRAEIKARRDAGEDISDEDVHDLTYLESRLMPNIALDTPITNVGAVRDIQKLFITKKTGLMDQFFKPGEKRPSIDFRPLIERAQMADRKIATREILKEKTQPKYDEMAKRYKNIEKVIASSEAPEPYLNEALSDIKDKMDKYAKILDITTKID